MKKLLGLTMVGGLLAMGEVKAAVVPECPIPKEAKLIYEAEKHICEPRDAGPPFYKAAKELEDTATADWLNIKDWIEPWHLAQGFIDILLSVHIEEMEDVLPPGWWMRVDSDDEVGTKKDLNMRAYCGGLFYDLIDKDFKVPKEEMFPTDNAFEEDGEDYGYVTLRFGLPERVRDYYKIFIGKGNVLLRSGETYYTNLCQVKLYAALREAELYAHCDLPDIPIKLDKKDNVVYDENGRPVRRVFIDTPVMFDASGSVNLSGQEIVSYAFDFDNNISPDVDIKGSNPAVSWTYTTLGRKKVVLKIMNAKGDYSIADGDVCVSESSEPLPLWVDVVEPTEWIDMVELNEEEKEAGIKVYQCAPHPFVPAKYPETRIKYLVSSPCVVSIKVYTFSGELVKTLVDGEKLPGEWKATWDGTNEDGDKVAGGVYFYSVEAGEYRSLKRILLVR